MTEQRAQVRIVAGDQSPPPSNEPEAQPPVPPAPPQELEPQIGGPLPTGPTPQQMAMGGGLADQMRAAFQAMDATEEFAVPGWTYEDGSPQLILVARTFGDRKTFTEGLPNEVFIAKSTHKLLWVDEQRERHEIPGGWGPGLADMLGVRAVKAADLVAMVISKPDPSNPEGRIPNVAGIGSLAVEIINWSARGQAQAELDLGE